QILTVALRVLLRTRVAHCDVEEPVGTELNAAATVVLGCAYHFEQAARGLAGVASEARRRLLLDDDRRDLSLLENLVLQIIFAILAKARVKGEAEQAVGAPFIKQLARKVTEQCFGDATTNFFEQPNLPGL